MFSFTINPKIIKNFENFARKYLFIFVFIFLSAISIYFFIYYLQNGLGLNYNDARSHLDIGRRVVEGLKPGLAQLGSVWLPLNHMLMVPLIWNDWAWHTGFAGTVWSMLSFVGTGLIIYKYLEELKVGILGRLTAVAVFVANVNVLYLQSTAMTELLMLFTLTASSYYLMKWHKSENINELIKVAFWVMMATLTRYDGWFMLGMVTVLIAYHVWKKSSYKKMEGVSILFLTVAAFGVVIWLAWNQLIFGDALYWAIGPYSAHAQQEVMSEAGALPTKYNLLLSIKVYFYALLYNSYTYPAILGMIGAIVLWCDRKIDAGLRISTTALMSPFIFNILALFLGFSVIYVQGISGDTWFNVRYGVMLAPTIAIFIGYLVDQAKTYRLLLIGSLMFVLFFAFANNDAVTIDDARVGSSQKNVSEVSGWLHDNAKDEAGFILISAASHDAIIFSSGLPMKKFIHEGTGAYWESATTSPDRWARWVVMRTHDNNDQTFKLLSLTNQLYKYDLVESYPFADIYVLKTEFIPALNTQPIYGRQK